MFAPPAIITQSTTLSKKNASAIVGIIASMTAAVNVTLAVSRAQDHPPITASLALQASHSKMAFVNHLLATPMVNTLMPTKSAKIAWPTASSAPVELPVQLVPVAIVPA
jgi:hypothetical protein